MVASHLNLAPALVDAGKASELAQTGKTLSTVFSPLDDSICVYVSPLTREQQNEEFPFYTANMSVAPSAERRLFLTDTHMIFSAVRHLEKQAQLHPADWILEPEQMTHVRKFGFDYVNFVKECWIHASRPLSQADGPPQFSADHYRSLYTVVSLFVLLYLPEPKYEGLPVGDELMEWLNTHFIEPSTEEGDQLSSLERPWEDETFWPYLTRTTLRGLTKAVAFFLEVLKKSHPSPDLRRISDSLIPVISNQPRLLSCGSEREFAMKSRKWRETVKALRVDLDRVPEDARQEDDEDEFEGWWESLSDIVGLLEGRAEVLIRVCKDLGADWKECIAAWGVFVNPRLRRADLPELTEILDELPLEDETPEDLIHYNFVFGEPVAALHACAELDPWLSAHLADIVQLADLIPKEKNEQSELSLRDEYILDFAQYLRSDPALWRITVSYMYTCGGIGERTADEVLLRVPIRNLEARTRLALQGDLVGVVKEISEVCLEYGREETRRAVCRVAAQMYVREKDYGLAISHAISAEDWSGVGLIINRVLDEYIVSGPKDFIGYASEITPRLPSIHKTDEGPLHSQGIFLHRLTFLTRFSRFLRLKANSEWQHAAADLVSIFRDDLCPKSWRAVLLYDAVELLRQDELLFTADEVTLLLSTLQEISTQCSQGSGEDYLPVFIRAEDLITENEALDKLDDVRFALAHYYARCAMIDVGGKTPVYVREPVGRA